MLLRVCCKTCVIELCGFAADLRVPGGIRTASRNVATRRFLPFYFMHRKFLAFAAEELENRSAKGRGTEQQIRKQVCWSALNPSVCVAGGWFQQAPPGAGGRPLCPGATAALRAALPVCRPERFVTGSAQERLSGAAGAGAAPLRSQSKR